ncbi:MAG: hypothetical protein ACP5MD_01870, partial [Verrucomicrobiia bacterium]
PAGGSGVAHRREAASFNSRCNCSPEAKPQLAHLDSPKLSAADPNPPHPNPAQPLSIGSTERTSDA